MRNPAELPIDRPTLDWYQVIDSNMRQSMVLNDKGGEELYGPNWEYVVSNQEEGVSVAKIAIMLH